MRCLTSDACILLHAGSRLKQLRENDTGLACQGKTRYKSGA